MNFVFTFIKTPLFLILNLSLFFFFLFIHFALLSSLIPSFSSDQFSMQLVRQNSFFFFIILLSFLFSFLCYHFNSNKKENKDNFTEILLLKFLLLGEGGFFKENEDEGIFWEFFFVFRWGELLGAPSEVHVTKQIIKEGILKWQQKLTLKPIKKKI